ncbi:MAG: RluA family pseudouridine synthase [Pirellulaceae bacterium]|nr:RluA family pseudouridine synthase [Pirellulaceae bacterium]
MPDHDGLSLAQALKRCLPEQSWSRVRGLIAGRQVQVNGNLCLDEGRRVKGGDVLKLWDHPLAKPADASDVRIVHLDDHLVVVHKPAGVTTLRHREESDLPQRRKQLQPTLDELLTRALAERLGIGGEPRRGDSRKRPRRGENRPDPRLRLLPVHRLDRDTSGLLVFARTREAEQRLIGMFSRHDVGRAYVAVAHGEVAEQTRETWLVRDRGDGLRGSSPLGASAEDAQRAVTHLRPMEKFAARGQIYTVVECRLETGRTHQIRIHLAELGHPLCGEKTYTHLPGQPPQADASRAPRHALHAASLAFVHPISGQALQFRDPLPKDLREWLIRLRGK